MWIQTLILACCILAAIAAHRKRASDEEAPSWEQMPGSAVQISAKGDNLWAMNRLGQPLLWRDGGWRYPHLTGNQISAASDGYAWMVTPSQPDFAKSNLWRYNPNSQVFEYLNNGGFAFVSTTGVSNAYLVGWTGCIWKWDGAGLALFDKGDCDHKNIGLRNTIQVSVGDSNELWKLEANSTIHRFAAGAWQKQEIPNYAKWIDVQSPGRVVMTDVDNNAWFWDAKAWTKVEGVKCAQATINYKYIYCVDRDERIWRLEF